MFLVLLLSAIGTSVLIFVFARNSEEDAFESESDGVAGRLVDGMISDVSLKFWIGRTLSSVITMAMEISGNSQLNLTMPVALWELITQEARYNANVYAVGWSPILFTDQDRLQFESYSRSQVFSAQAHPSCSLCGEASKGYINPLDSVEIPGFGQPPEAIWMGVPAQVVLEGRTVIPSPKSSVELVNVAIYHQRLRLHQPTNSSCPSKCSKLLKKQVQFQSTMDKLLISHCGKQQVSMLRRL